MLQFDYPSYLVVVCILIAAIFTYFLYWFRGAAFSPKVNATLALVRFLAVFLISLFLLRPLLNYSQSENEKPLLLVGIDNSLSVLQNADSTYYQSGFKNDVNKALEGVSSQFEIKWFSLGEKTKPLSDTLTFAEKQTDLSEWLTNMEDYYAYANVGAVVLASDGLYNKGNHPEYVQTKLKAPIFTIAMGDSTAQIDQWISKVRKNKLSFLGNDLPIEVSVRSSLLKGKKTRLSISGFGRLLEKKELEYQSDEDFVTFQFMVKAEKVGNQAIRIQIDGIEGESSLKNNSELVFIEVIDARQKVLLLSSVTHPDVATIRQAIENNENYEVTFLPTRKLKELTQEELDNKYSLVILNQIPARGAGASYQSVLNSKLPKLYVLGNLSDINYFNGLNTGLKIEAHNGRLNEAQAKLNVNFVPFLMKKEEWAYLQEAPPLKIPFGKYTVSNSEVLFYQRIGSVATQDPIWMLGTNNGEKVGVIAGEGLWRWRLYERGNLNKTSALDEILDRTVNYLATRESKTRFRLESAKKIQENENLIFQGEFYNESFELTNDEDVFLQIEKESGDKFDFVMKRKDNFYYLDAGVWEPGVYQYQAKLVQGGKSFEKSGQVSVTPISAEYISNRADFGLLSRISAKSGGEMVTARNLASLEQTLKSINAPVVVHTETKFEDLINLKWIFALLLLLLSLEWFVRKREGSI